MEDVFECTFNVGSLYPNDMKKWPLKLRDRIAAGIERMKRDNGGSYKVITGICYPSRPESIKPLTVETGEVYTCHVVILRTEE